MIMEFDIEIKVFDYFIWLNWANYLVRYYYWEYFIRIEVEEEMVVKVMRILKEEEVVVDFNFLNY